MWLWERDDPGGLSEGAGGAETNESDISTAGGCAFRGFRMGGITERRPEQDAPRRGRQTTSSSAGERAGAQAPRVLRFRPAAIPTPARANPVILLRLASTTPIVRGAMRRVCDWSEPAQNPTTADKPFTCAPPGQLPKATMAGAHDSKLPIRLAWRHPCLARIAPSPGLRYALPD